jgi:hypothetical protein
MRRKRNAKIPRNALVRLCRQCLKWAMQDSKRLAETSQTSTNLNFSAAESSSGAKTVHLDAVPTEDLLAEIARRTR